MRNTFPNLSSETTENGYWKKVSFTSPTIRFICSKTRSGEIGKAKNYADIRIATLHLAHHLDEDVDLPALAAKVGLGYPLFRKKFHAYTDMAPLEYLVALRIRRACNLLQSSSIPIAKIARDTGFKTPAYFSRFFRAKMGQSPIEFRNTHLNDCR